MRPITQKLLLYANLMRFHKPIGSFLLLWPTLMALWIAALGNPPLSIVIIFIIGVFVMRSAGCVINDFADRSLDGHVQRTKNRPLAKGGLKPKEALILFSVLVVFAFFLALQLNFLTLLLSSIALSLAIIYPFMKRYTHFPQLILGMAYSFGIPMAFTAIQQTLTLDAWILYSANLFWVMAYDTEYAMVDREDDLIVGIKSTAILFGAGDRFYILLFHLVSLSLFCLLGIRNNLGFLYFSGIIAAAGLVAYQQYLIFNREPSLCFKAFLNNNILGGLLFLGLFLDFFKNN